MQSVHLGKILFWLGVGCWLVACGRNEPADLSSAVDRRKEYIRKIPGKNDTVPEQVVARGEVLIAYSDCYDCHREEKKSKGPAFSDIAERYPIQPAYRDLLARKIISGGFGSWGNPVMSPHPEVSMEDAQTMVYYILSLKYRPLQ
jgi:cytochrome c